MPTGAGAWGLAKAPSGHRRPPDGLQPRFPPAGWERAGPYDDPSGDRSTSAATLDGLQPKEFVPRLAARPRIRLEGADRLPSAPFSGRIRPSTRALPRLSGRIRPSTSPGRPTAATGRPWTSSPAYRGARGLESAVQRLSGAYSGSSVPTSGVSTLQKAPQGSSRRSWSSSLTPLSAWSALCAGPRSARLRCDQSRDQRCAQRREQRHDQRCDQKRDLVGRLPAPSARPSLRRR
jgi:hypothetical protein